jgi:hypothetical protein
MGIRAHGDANSSRQAKISELEAAVLVNEQILGLQIAVQDAVGVTKVQSLDELV